MTSAAERPLHLNRDFNLLWLGSAASQFGSMLSLTAYPLIALALTGSATLAGAIAAANQLPHLLFQLPAGSVVDRVDRKRLMILCDAGRAAALLSIPLAVALSVLSPLQLILTAFIEGSCTVFFRVAETGAIRNVVPRGQYSAAAAANQARTFGAAFLGRPTAGVLFEASRALPFLVDAVSYLASLAATALTRGAFQEERATGLPRSRPWREALDGFAWLWQRPVFRLISVMLPLATVILQALPLVVIVLADELGHPPSVIGFILLGFSIGGLSGSVSGGWVSRRLRLGSVIVANPWLWLVACLAIAALPHPVVIVAATAVVGFGNAAWNVAVSAYQLSSVPDGLVGRVGAATRLIASSAASFGPLAAGLALDAWGGQGTTVALAGACAGLAIVATLYRSAAET